MAGANSADVNDPTTPTSFFSVTAKSKQQTLFSFTPSQTFSFNNKESAKSPPSFFNKSNDNSSNIRSPQSKTIKPKNRPTYRKYDKDAPNIIQFTAAATSTAITSPFVTSTFSFSLNNSIAENTNASLTTLSPFSFSIKSETPELPSTLDINSTEISTKASSSTLKTTDSLFATVTTTSTTSLFQESPVATSITAAFSSFEFTNSTSVASIGGSSVATVASFTPASRTSSTTSTSFSPSFGKPLTTCAPFTFSFQKPVLSNAVCMETPPTSSIPQQNFSFRNSLKTLETSPATFSFGSNSATSSPFDFSFAKPVVSTPAFVEPSKEKSGATSASAANDEKPFFKQFGAKDWNSVQRNGFINPNAKDKGKTSPQSNGKLQVDVKSKRVNKYAKDDKKTVVSDEKHKTEKTVVTSSLSSSSSLEEGISQLTVLLRELDGVKALNDMRTVSTMIESLEQTVNSIQDCFKCDICFNSQYNYLYFCSDCGRMVGCFMCAYRLDRCPTCRKRLPIRKNRVPYMIPGLATALNEKEVSREELWKKVEKLKL